MWECSNLHTCCVSFVCCPLRFNFYAAFLMQCVMTETAPLPILGTLHQSAFNGIAMDVLQFFDELCIVAKVAIKVALLP